MLPPHAYPPRTCHHACPYFILIINHYPTWFHYVFVQPSITTLASRGFENQAGTKKNAILSKAAGQIKGIPISCTRLPLSTATWIIKQPLPEGEPAACRRRLPLHQDLRPAMEMAEGPAAPAMAAAARASAEAAAPSPFPRFIPGVVNMLAITCTTSLPPPVFNPEIKIKTGWDHLWSLKRISWAMVFVCGPKLIHVGLKPYLLSFRPNQFIFKLGLMWMGSIAGHLMSCSFIFHGSL